MLDALFFGAHPDDVELVAGGLAALLASHGHRVGIADLTRGERGTRGDADERAAEAAAAARELGVAWRGSLGLPDLGLGRGDRAQLAAVVACLREHRPGLVVAPDEHDAHPDHVEASHLVARACHLAGLAGFPDGAAGAGATAVRHRPARLLYYSAVAYLQAERSDKSAPLLRELVSGSHGAPSFDWCKALVSVSLALQDRDLGKEAVSAMLANHGNNPDAWQLAFLELDSFLRHGAHIRCLHLLGFPIARD